MANAIRALAMDAVQRANSGHPGAPMGMADFATVLWTEFLSHNPKNPAWPNRDRFVLSNGHGSMLIYALLHLSGYDLPIDEIKNFRQLHSKTAGHPEFGITPGVETTTGPLGQGLANAVGMALAERLLASEFNRDGFALVDHFTYVAVGDGCLMEGISHEACSLAGTMGLSKLIALYDDNGISIDGEVSGWFTDNTPARFESYGWQVIRDVDGHDPEAIRRALSAARDDLTRPSFIAFKTEIGRGAPTKAGTAGAHGAPLGDEEIANTRAALGWDHAPFEIPAAVYEAFDASASGAAREAEWHELEARYRAAHPELAAEFARRIEGDLPENFDTLFSELLGKVWADDAKIATRKASGNVLDAIAPQIPELLGGSADLTGSNNTEWKGATWVTPEHAHGRYISYGVREFAMTAVANGLSLHGGFIPYVGTFLVFSDYARNAVRLAALMKQRVVLVYTHDSIGLGEDGPTHQPVEHAASLRLIPNVDVWRPADAVETVVAWQAALHKHDGPSCLLLSRQGLPPQPRAAVADADAIVRGAYVVQDVASPELVIIATGSELEIARQAGSELSDSGTPTRVVSMPCAERFQALSDAEQAAIVPRTLRQRVVIEAGASGGWGWLTGLDGLVIGIDRFGESAPAGDLFALFGLTKDEVLDRIRSYLSA